MTTKTFEITYTDPETKERKTITQAFEELNILGEMTISCEEWAEDYAYTLADKNNDYEIREIK